MAFNNKIFNSLEAMLLSKELLKPFNNLYDELKKISKKSVLEI